MGLINKFRKKEYQVSTQEEVIEHLIDFLNTKRNFGAYPMDYGIDTYIYAGTGKQVVVKIIADIVTGLERYEKRIDFIDITHVPTENPFLLSFRIHCKIHSAPLSFHLSFHHQQHVFEKENNP